MNFDIKGILRFLFPEWQVIEAIKREGFVAKPNRNETKHQTSNSGQIFAGGYASAPDNPVHRVHEVRKDILKRPAVEQKGNIDAYQYKNAANAGRKDISEAFDSIRNELGSLLIGQTNYLDNLCLAFKRPFITGYDRHKPKNVIFVLGSKGTGRHTSITHIARLMKQKKLVISNAVLTIDLSLYNSASDFGLFLPDLYKCLYGQSDIVLFDNFSQCHSSVIDAITTLTLTGKYTLGSRYVFQNNNLVEAIGMLMQDSISEISSNGKYFVFISEKSEKDVLDVFGTKFMDAIGDIVHIEDFSYDELIRIAHKTLENLKEKYRENLSISVNYDKTLARVIADSYKSPTGVGGMQDYANRYIYKPLAEYKLKNRMEVGQSIHLSVVDGQLTAQIADKNISLSEMLPQKPSSGIEDVKHELDNIIGIESVKEYILSLEDHLKIQRLRENAGYKAVDISMHMIFTGNPGTGKTTAKKP
mgnify:CR=1 FL=1